MFGGAGIGAGIGAAAGDPDDDLYPLAIFAGAVIGGGSGLLIGSLVGASIKTDRWEAVPLERIRVSLMPAGNGGLGVVVSVRVP